MQLERKCKQCGTHLSDDKKLGAQYCNHACSQGYYKRRRRILDQINKLEGDIKFNENWIGELANQSIELDKNIVDLSPLTQNLTSAVKKLETSDILNPVIGKMEQEVLKKKQKFKVEEKNE